MNPKRSLTYLFASATLLGACVAGAAQSDATQASVGFPQRPVTVIVPWPAGGFTDVYARKVSEKMAQDLGQPVIVENKPGANGAIGTAFVARSNPDGYTIVIETADTHAINPSIYPPADLRYDPIKDFRQVSILSSQPLILAVGGNVAARSVDDLVRMAKARPGELSYATWGKGSVPHLGIVRFSKVAGIDLNHIPYKGVSPAAMDVMAGRVDMMLTGLFTSSDHFKNGTMRPLAAASNQRMAMMPELPTLQELGYPDLELRLWYGLGVPTGTPDAVVERLHKAASVAMASDDIKALLDKNGMDIHNYDPARATQHVLKERERWAAAAEAAGDGLGN